MSVSGVAFAVVCALWFMALPPALIVASSGPAAFTWPLVLALAPVAALIARRKGQRRLAWGLLALPPVWIVLSLVVSSWAASL